MVTSSIGWGRRSGTTVYLDHQASTPVKPEALEAMIAVFSTGYGNPHSVEHAVGWAAADVVEEARGRVATAIGASADEVVFTSGATEANNLALLGAAAGDERGRSIVVSAVEHSSVLAVARALADAGRELRVVPVGVDGRIDMAALEDALRGDVFMASIGWVNGEIGVVQDLPAISELCRSSGALLHSDATQALAWNAVDVEAAGVDFASVSSHKVGGAQGVGALFVSANARDRLSPVLHGGGQEWSLRPGTLPTALCAGFGVACATLPGAEEVAGWRAKTGVLRTLVADAFPGAALNGAEAPRHPGNLNLLLPGVDAELLLARVQPAVAFSRGSACTSGMSEPSHVLRAIGLTADEAAMSVRLSTGPDTSRGEIEAAVLSLREAWS